MARLKSCNCMLQVLWSGIPHANPDPCISVDAPSPLLYEHIILCIIIILLLLGPNHRQRNRGHAPPPPPPNFHSLQGGAKNVHVEYCMYGHNCDIYHELCTMTFSKPHLANHPSDYYSLHALSHGTCYIFNP